MDLLLDHTIISSPVPSRSISDSYAFTAFTILTLDSSVYQFTPKCIDLREYPVLSTLTKADSFYFHVIPKE